MGAAPTIGCPGAMAEVTVKSSQSRRPSRYSSASTRSSGCTPSLRRPKAYSSRCGFQYGLAPLADRYLYVTRDVDGNLLSLLDDTRQTVGRYQTLEQEGTDR